MDFPRVCPARFFPDHHFGLSDYFYPFYESNINYYRPRKWHTQSCTNEFGSIIENEKGNYKISLDVKHFHPNEISVKVSDEEITVEGKHEERADTHGFVTRYFKRRYPLPKNFSSENVTSTLSSDGILIIVAEKGFSLGNSTIVPIKMCGLSPRQDQIETKVISESSQKQSLNGTSETLREEIKITNESILQEEHSRLLKPELLKQAIPEENGEQKESKIVELITNNETIVKNGVGNGNATTSTLEESNDFMNMKSDLELAELAGKLAKSLAATSQMSATKSMSQTTKQESSSYKASMSTSSTMSTNGKTSDYINESISAELREAAEIM